MREELQMGCFVVLVLIFIMLIGGSILLTIDHFRCHARWEQSGYEANWGPVQGCLIKVEGKWIPADRWWTERP